MNPVGKITGLESTKLRGAIDVDPERQDFFRVAIEERKRLSRRTDIAPEEKAQNYRGIFEVIWDRLWPSISKAQTVEEVVEAIKKDGRPYDQTFEPLAGLIFQVSRDPTFPSRPNSQKRFLADSLGAFGVVSPRRSRDICSEERGKDQRKHHIIRFEYYVECSCGYEGPSKDRACRNCGAGIPASLFG